MVHPLAQLNTLTHPIFSAISIKIQIFPFKNFISKCEMSAISILSRAPFYQCALTLILAWISNYINLYSVGWDYSFIPKLQQCSRWSSGMDKQFTGHVIIYPCWDWSPGLNVKPRRGGTISIFQRTFLIHFLDWKFWLKFILKLSGLTNNKWALVQVMSWCQSGDKPLPEAMITHSLIPKCVIWTYWVKKYKGHMQY